MKAKHIISAVLIVILPIVLIGGTANLERYFSFMKSTTLMLRYLILYILTTTVPIIAYVFWLSFVMRTKEHKARIIIMCCSFFIAAVLFSMYFCFWGYPFSDDTDFLLTTVTIGILANFFAAIYMLVKYISTRKVKE